MRSRTAFTLVAVLVSSLAACNPSGKASPHESLTSLDPLRRAFNADSGKVRAIFLASPT
jgi:hypothetical protein